MAVGWYHAIRPGVRIPVACAEGKRRGVEYNGRFSQPAALGSMSRHEQHVMQELLLREWDN
jgi:hypothetical protein